MFAKKRPNRKFSDGPAVRTLHFQRQGAQAWSLVGELRSHVPFSKKKKKKKSKYLLFSQQNKQTCTKHQWNNQYIPTLPVHLVTHLYDNGCYSSSEVQWEAVTGCRCPLVTPTCWSKIKKWHLVLQQIA